MWLAICAVLLVIWWVFIRDEEDPLDKLPGPSRLPIIGNILEIMKIRPDDFFHSILKYSREYGERIIFKIVKKRILHISNCLDIEAVMSHPRNITKGLPYNFLQPWLGTGLLLSKGKKWHTRRKILTPTFHFNILKSYFLIMQEKSRNLVTALREAEGKEVNLLPVISEFTLYIICETAMGTQLDADKSTASVEYKNAIMHIGRLLIDRTLQYWMHTDIVFNRTKQGKSFNRYLKTVNDFAEKVIMERRRQHDVKNATVAMEEDGSKRRLALLDLLLEAERKGDIDFEGIREEVNTFMFGGHDTTSKALTFCLMIIADYEVVQEQMYEECQRVFEKCEGNPTMADFSDMKYLEAVIKETLRLYPSAPIIGRVVDEDFMMRDLLVKKDTNILINIYNLHRCEDMFPDPEQFKPERFLYSEIKHPYAYVPFSAGPRNCVGQRFAMLEMKSILSEIIRNFKLEPKVKGWRPPLTTAIVLRPLEPIYVKFIPRY